MHEQSMRKSILTIAFITGLLAIVTQTLLYREISIVVKSNELILGVILASWLIFVGLGSLISFMGAKFRVSVIAFIIACCISMVWVHLNSIWFTPEMGAIWPFSRTLLLIAISVFPPAFLNGTLFSSLTRKFMNVGDPSKIYIYEGFGSLCGGILSLILVTLIPSRVIMPLFVAIGFSGILSVEYRKKGRLVFIILTLLAFISIHLLNVLDNDLFEKLRPGYSLERFESANGPIEIAERENEFYLFKNGVYIGSSGDSLKLMPIVYSTMPPIDGEKRILIHGGILDGAVNALQKYDSTQITCLLSNKKVLSVGASTFRNYRNLQGQKIHTIFGDPRRSIALADGKFDIVYLFPGIPQSSLSARLITRETFARIHSKLNDNGRIIVAFPGSPNIIDIQIANILSSVKQSMQSVFDSASVYLINGMAVIVAPDNDQLGENIRLGKIYSPDPRYPKGMLSAMTDKFRNDDIRRRISETSIEPNTDSHPVAFMVGLILWENLADSGLISFFSRIDIKIWLLIILSAATIVSISEYVFTKHHFTVPALSVFSGAIGMACTIISLYSFQLAVGKLYAALGILSALFLFGSVIGARISSTTEKITPVRWRLLAILIIPMITGIIKIVSFAPPVWLGLTIFGIFHIYIGFIVGTLYPILLKWSSRTSFAGNKAAGIFYGLDLIGSSIAAPLVGVVLVPSMGIDNVVLMISITILISIILSFKLRGEK